MATLAEAQRTFEKGVAEHRAGRVAQAERLYQQVLAREPKHEQAQFLAAAIAIDAGRSQEAVRILERLVAQQPSNAVYFTNLGEARRRLGELEGAAAALVRAVELAPELVQAQFNLGLVTQQLGEAQLSIEAFERAADLKPESAPIQSALARALMAQQEYARAIGHWQCVLLQNAATADTLTDYATCLRKLGRHESAIRYAERALALDSGFAGAHRERAASLVELSRFDQALDSAARATELAPDSAHAHSTLASAFTFSGRLDEGIAAYRRAIELDPQDALLHSNLVFLLGFQDGTDAAQILAEARRWAERHAPQSTLSQPHPGSRDKNRKLRVGYVSSNFYDHCQAFFTLPLLQAHDRSQFELHAFSSTPRSDGVTARLRDGFDHWLDISGLDATAAVAAIRSREIDLLIDLTMHMSVSQLDIFAHKPAPVQISWLAYPGTTGLSAIDYRVTDHYLDPPGNAQPYSEASLVLPDTFWCYHPNTNDVPVGELPLQGNGHVTFGCLNSFWKLNERTVRLWAKVLQRVAGSQLHLLAPEGGARSRVLETFETAGVARERITFLARRPRAEYLKLYQQIDVCLDAVPYNGHTTSLDAFWMGVPVVTLVGSTVVGRAGLCQAMNLGLPELVAHDEGEFVQAAAALVERPAELAALRAGLRERMQRSPLMDGERFVRNLEAKYREAWQRWCDSQPS